MKRGLILLGLWLSACSSPTEKAILSKEKLALILTDIHLAEAKINEKHIGSSDSALVLFQEIQKGIFKKHQVDSSLVNRSFEAYVKEPDEFLEMYQLVSDELTKKVKPH
ncbi:MAG: hypothetical protein RJA76_1228 [Bacteroidota bacterium]|jgi:hypothetical protein